MADHKFNETIASLVNGMDTFLSTKTVVGEPINVNDTLIIPLVDVSFGAGAGAWGQERKNSAGGGMGGKISPNAVLVIKNGNVRIIPVSSSDPVSKIIDMAPDLINKFTGKGEDPEVQSAIDDIARDEGERFSDMEAGVENE